MVTMSTSSCMSDSDDSGRDQYEPIRKLAMVQLHPPRNPNKPFTSFNIRDILSNSSSNNGSNSTNHQNAINNNNNNHLHSNRNLFHNPHARIVRPWASGSSPGHDSIESSDGEDEEINVDDDDAVPNSLKAVVSPLDALMEMANKTFQGLETADAADAKRREQAALFGKHQPPKKRRKSRTAFTNQQIYELEKRFLYQKYLTPADRDEIAQSLNLTNAQVITWFQNRRAKLKRDLEELKNDVTAATKVTKKDDYENESRSGDDIDDVSGDKSEDDDDSSPSPAKIHRKCVDSDGDLSDKDHGIDVDSDGCQSS